MPLEKFIPLSPDPYITQDSDMKLAQFGHLNTIVDYLNTYVVADSLQLEGVGPLSATARYITDSAGNLSSLAISTGNIGIGTTNATARLRVISADTNGIAEFFQNGAASSPLVLTRYTGLVAINLNTAAGGSASPVPVGDNIQMSRITTNTYNGTAFANAARIEVLTKGIQSATNYGTAMRFLTTPENATSMNEVMSLTSDGNVQIGIGYLVAGGAKLAIKGSGSTVATTSLLVQNSSGTEIFKVLDNGSTSCGLGFLIGSNQSISDGTFALNNQNLQSYNSFSIETVPQNRQIKLRPASVEVLAANYYLANGQIGVVVYDTGSYSHNASAVLQVNSTTRGFLKPKMTTAQKNAIVTPTAGLEIYDTDLNRPCYFNGTSWITV